MAKQTSAGLLMFNIIKNEIEVFLCHPGGPYFQFRDVWDIPKGKVDPGENILAGAKREFTEETGFSPKGPFYYLGNVLTKGKGKKVHIWVFKGNFQGPIKSNTFKIENPKGSGKFQEYPECDKGEWFTLKKAKKKIYSYQAPLLDELEDLLVKNELI